MECLKPKKEMLTSTTSQCVDALQHIATHAEHLPPQTFVVKSNPVKTSLDSRSNEKNECLKEKVECAHTNSCSYGGAPVLKSLTNIFSKILESFAKKLL